jgi:hypothetical protein
MLSRLKYDRCHRGEPSGEGGSVRREAMNAEPESRLGCGAGFGSVDCDDFR